MQNDLNQLIHARKGHFLLESGHHGDLWLDLELLCLQPHRIQPFAAELAGRLGEYQIDAVCGPLVEGAFVGLMVAGQLDVEFVYTEHVNDGNGSELFPAKYLLPAALRERISGKRVAIVNDVINAGSAVRGTFADLTTCGATTVAMATLLTLGDAAKTLAEEWGVDLITLSSQSSTIWKPEECPLCLAGTPLDGS